MKNIKWYWYALAVVVIIILAILDFKKWHIVFKGTAPANAAVNLQPGSGHAIITPPPSAAGALVLLTPPLNLPGGNVAYYKQSVMIGTAPGVKYYDVNKNQIIGGTPV